MASIYATHARIDVAKQTVGLKAVANAASATVTTFATFGTYKGNVFSVSDIDRATGYNTSYAVARGSTELGFGVATGGLAMAGRAGKLGTYGGRAAQGVFGLDVLGNGFMVGQGASSMMLDGVTWENAIQVVGGIVGIGGNIAGFGRSVQCPPPNGVTKGIGGVSVEDLLHAGQQADRNGLTKAGRALQKHGDRSGSVFPRSLGNSAARNIQGQSALEGILNSGSKTTRQNRFGGQDIFDIATGRGARYDGNGNFMGFLEP